MNPDVSLQVIARQLIIRNKIELLKLSAIGTLELKHQKQLLNENILEDEKIVRS